MGRPLEKTPLMRFSQVAKDFSGKRVLDSISFTVFAPEVLTINGPNGSGKSTLLRIISGLSPVSAGVREVSKEKLKIGYVPDRFPKLNFTPREYVSSMGRLQGISSQQPNARIEELLERFCLDFAADQRMLGYSKGMLQKVNIMQAILERPDLLLLDEPLSGLDRAAQHEMVSVVRELKQQGVGIVLTGHQSSLLENTADRVITLANGVIAADSVINHPDGEVVVIQASFASGEWNPGLFDSNPAVLSMESKDGVITLQVHTRARDDVLRTLLSLEGSILSVNPLHGELARVWRR